MSIGYRGAKLRKESLCVLFKISLLKTTHQVVPRPNTLITDPQSRSLQWHIHNYTLFETKQHHHEYYLQTSLLQTLPLWNVKKSLFLPHYTQENERNRDGGQKGFCSLLCSTWSVIPACICPTPALALDTVARPSRLHWIPKATYIPLQNDLVIVVSAIHHIRKLFKP